MVEVWKQIKQFPNYEVSNLGRVRSPRKVLKPYKNEKGYLRVNLRQNGVSKNLKVHRIVAEAFIENTFSKPEVNHINGNKLHNYSDNLEWCTGAENIAHAFETKLIKGECTPIGVYRNGIYVTTLSGKRQIRDYGLDPSAVSRCLNGERSLHKGFTFKRF